MSQSANLAGSGTSVSSPKASTAGRAIALLAVAVLIGVAGLNALDDAPAINTAAETGTGAQTQDDATSAPFAQTQQQPQAAEPGGSAAAAPPLRAPSEVKVLVANGVGVTGAASKVAGRLQPAGYQLVKPGNTLSRVDASLVQYAPGYTAEAQALAMSLGMPLTAVQQMANPAPVAELQGANVIVIVGTELANAAQTQAATPLPDSATATTGAPAGAAASGPQPQPAPARAEANPATNGPLGQLSSTDPQPAG